MILANWPRRASEEPHSSTAPNRLVEAYFLPWSVSMSCDAPYWRPPSRGAQYGPSVEVMVPKPVSGPRHDCFRWRPLERGVPPHVYGGGVRKPAQNCSRVNPSRLVLLISILAVRNG